MISNELEWPILKAEKRRKFDEILFTRIQNIVHLRMDHNMIDNEMIFLIATQWNHCLKLLEIDCRYAYRNFQFSYDRPGGLFWVWVWVFWDSASLRFGWNGLKLNLDALDWIPFNIKCPQTRISFILGGLT